MIDIVDKAKDLFFSFKKDDRYYLDKHVLEMEKWALKLTELNLAVDREVVLVSV